jgi:hypothetical protein
MGHKKELILNSKLPAPSINVLHTTSNILDRDVNPAINPAIPQIMQCDSIYWFGIP